MVYFAVLAGLHEVRHMREKASAGEFSGLGSIVLRSLIAEISSRDLSDSILRPVNRNGKTSCLCTKEPGCSTV
jgi:hypothetical protein